MNHRLALLTLLAAAGLTAAGCGVHFNIVGESGSDSGLPFDAGELGPDAGEPGPDASQPAVLVTGFQGLWSTPNTIQWGWSNEGDLHQLAEFQLVIGGSQQDVASRSGTARVVTKAENPELGVASLTGNGDGGLSDPVVTTNTAGLTPATPYWAQLEAVDRSGARSTSAIVSLATVVAPNREIIIFSEAPPAGYSVGTNFHRGTTDAYSGTYDYEIIPNCPSGSCSDQYQLGWGDLGLDTSIIPQASFDDDAFVEFAVQNQGTTSLYSQARLSLKDCADTTTEISVYEPFPISSGGYRLYQAPLRVFRYSAGPIPYSALAPGLCKFDVGGHWTHARLVLVDEVRIRWRE